ncbi:MAG: hypothetical protein M4579_001532 [Chaenotheca gracillima]|nr:MAG: hypothetical protein M4579_001532 [Chaenotheca gracillima]
MIISFSLAWMSNFVLSQGSNTKDSSCCSVLQDKLGQRVSFPGSADYSNEQNGTETGYFSAQEIEITPTCRVTPLSAQDVSVAVAALSESQCKFAIRGGGHTAWGGAANIQDGVTIDLSSLTDIEPSTDRKVTSVGAGARWGDVYLKLDELNLAVVGGRVDTIVLASGEIVDANATSHPDLFQALKGGGNNFGVVTRFDLITFELGKMWGGIINYPYEDVSTQLQFLQDYTTATGAAADSFASMENTYVFNASGGISISGIFGYSKDEPYPDIFKNFTDIQPQVSNSLRTTNLTDLTIEGEGGIPSGGRYSFATSTFANNATLLEYILSLAEATFKPTLQGTANFAFILEPLPKVLTHAGAKKGGNSLGLDEADDMILLDFNALWTDPEDDEAIDDVTQDFIKKVDDYTKKQGQYKEWIYLNYAAQWQDPIASYGAQNLEKLRSVSKKYDPDQTFQKLVPGGYKLYRQD